ncbi:RRP15-like protein [Physella acuta]|uniref:RRP15-like protein n=1 Tax=Physella acuta TaxID=109671 RepID=UPI0027DCD650|nr:RRP15-like protein [Physella acuta]
MASMNSETDDDDYDYSSENSAGDRLSDLEDDRHSDIGTEGNPQENVEEKSGMASVVARILSKDISKSNRVLLAKGKTNKEILKDISDRKRLREETKDGDGLTKPKNSKKIEKRSEFFKEEKRKIWESMGRKKPSVLDNPREVRLRKIATQGMVQLFRSVNEHQKLMKEKLSSVGPSERKKDMVMSEFTKGKFLDRLKGKSPQIMDNDDEKKGKWKILQDDFMLGAKMKDWDKDDNSDGDANEESMEDDDLSDDN